MSQLLGVIGLVVMAVLYLLIWWKVALFVKTEREYYKGREMTNAQLHELLMRIRELEKQLQEVGESYEIKRVHP